MAAKKSMRSQMGFKGISRKNFGLTKTRQKQKGIRVGTDRDTGSPVVFDLGLFRTHIHCIGRTGTGKTRFEALLARQLIEQGVGGCAIDIQGGLYHLMENYIAHNPHLAERVIFFNPGERQDPVVAFNPLKDADYVEQPIRVDMVIEALKKNWNQAADFMPTFEDVASNIIPALIDGGQTILEGKYFKDWINTAERDRILEHITDPDVLRDWEIFDAQGKHDKKTDILPFKNRIKKFLRLEMLRCTLGRTTQLLDFKDLVDKRKFLLVNLRYPRHLSFDAATLIGINLIHEIFYYCMSRHEKEAEQNPFVMIIDEMQNFITPDIVRILDQCRQKGLHLVLAHQRLNQLKEDNKELYSAVNSNARTKVVFAVPFEDAKLLADEIFEYDLQEVKHYLKTISIVDYRLEYLTAYHESVSKGSGIAKGRSLTKGRSSTTGGSATTGYSSSSGHSLTSAHGEIAGQSSLAGESQSQAAGTTWPTDYPLGGSSHEAQASAVMNSHGEFSATTNLEALTEMESETFSDTETDIWADTEMEAETESEAVSTSQSQSKGKSQVPTILPVLGEQITQETLYTLQDQQYRAAQKLKKQPRAGACIKREEDPAPIMAAIDNVPDYEFAEEKIREAHHISEQTNPCYLPITKTLKAIKARQKQIEQKPAKPQELKPQEPKPGQKPKLRVRTNR